MYPPPTPKLHGINSTDRIDSGPARERLSKLHDVPAGGLQKAE